ncbi:YwbE family protein [Sphaerochaeta sp.]|uniref:YwbE family protein n=1 Tax=Sphaerochaeta sp. TaxID=1972642 RepID=UPI002A371584|nr:YwbE family protein [Sphaerochaeta sp.]
MDGKRRADIHAGLEVLIVLKQDQATGNTTKGVVKDILTNSSTHPHTQSLIPVASRDCRQRTSFPK